MRLILKQFAVVQKDIELGKKKQTHDGKARTITHVSTHGGGVIKKLEDAQQTDIAMANAMAHAKHSGMGPGGDEEEDTPRHSR